MTKGEAQLQKDRAALLHAKSALDSQIARVKADLDAKGLGARAAQKVVEQSREAAEIGLDVARERKGVVAGTIGALLLWLCRKPLARAAGGAFERLRRKDSVGRRTWNRLKGAEP